MNWLQNNTYIVVLFVVFFIMVVFVLISGEEFIYEQIEVQNGDTLWELSEKYSGNMSKQKWIQKVINENEIKGETIIAGSKLIVPVSNDLKEIQSVKVAIEN